MKIGDIVRVGEREIPRPALKPQAPQEPAAPSHAPQRERDPEPREPERREPEREPERREPEPREPERVR